MKRLNKVFLVAIVAVGVVSTLNSCKKADTPTGSGASGIFNQGGLFISNEGAFGSANGSISYYDPNFNNVSNDIFSLQNNRPLGDVVQSITKIGNAAYICVNASNKIEVANSSDLSEISTISGITQPRYMVGTVTTGYASCWGNGGEIAIIDLASNAVTGTIAVGSGPENMVIANNNLYVMNSGGYGLDSTISVIDINTNTVTTTITLSGYNPTAVVKDAANNVWVLAKGQTIYDANWAVIGHDPSKLFKINSSTNIVESTTDLFATDHPNTLGVSPNGSTLYIGGSWGFTGIYTVNTAAPATPVTPLINQTCYGFLINSGNGNIFLLQEASSASGTLMRYDPSGTLLGQYTVGIYPNGGSNKK